MSTEWTRSFPKLVAVTGGFVRHTVAIALTAALAWGCAGPAPVDETAGRLAPLLEGMGEHTHPIDTDVPMAQRFFDQGLALAYGFNHAEAERSFQEAARLDPDCAMCYWGQALVLGPNINAAAMEDEAVPKAWAALERARELAAKATDKQRAYIEALGARYEPEPSEDRTALEAAYADAMRELARSYPDDLDAATLFAESLMVTTPWDYWLKDGTPKEVTVEVLATLESVLERDPDHPGANHFYIHAVEAVHPERGVAAAERLGGLVPGAGHLVHMPSHIFLRVGRYHDAAVANERAIEADSSYIAQCHAQGVYPVAYVPHNQHFLWAAATLEGRSAVALEAAHHMAAHQDRDLMREPGYGTLQHYAVTPLYAQVRFGRWDEILAAPVPEEDLVYPTGVWRYARALALTRTGRLEEAAAELEALEALATDERLEGVTIWDINTTASLLEIAAAVAAGELAAARDDFDSAIEHLRRAVALEDGLNYDEPPPWHQPVRQVLGAVLLEAGRAAEAEAVYREDLERVPENGWSLLGLAASLGAQGRDAEAGEAAQRLATAWQHADFELPGSRI